MGNWKNLTDLKLAEEAYYNWLIQGMSEGLALIKAAEQFTLMKSTLAKFLLRNE